MAWGAFGVLTLVFAAIFLVIQRAERSRRLVTGLILLLGLELLRRYILFRELGEEGAWALAAALLVNALFWVFYGRSNPPRSSAEEIEVIGNE